MGNKSIYLAIPKELHRGNVDVNNINKTVDSIMSMYVEHTAKKNMAKVDSYFVGGRFRGLLGVKKGTRNIYPTSDGCFGYIVFDNYDTLFSNGKTGPYIVENCEYVPANGAYVKDIQWDLVHDVQKLTEYTSFNLYMDKAGEKEMVLRDGLLVQNDGVYFDDQNKSVVLKRGETFLQYKMRFEEAKRECVLIPYAYVDKSGVWHDDSQVYDSLLNQDSDMREYAEKEFKKQFFLFLDSLEPDDYFVVLDGHLFP